MDRVINFTCQPRFFFWGGWVLHDYFSAPYIKQVIANVRRHLEVIVSFVVKTLEDFTANMSASEYESVQSEWGKCVVFAGDLSPDGRGIQLACVSACRACVCAFAVICTPPVPCSPPLNFSFLFFLNNVGVLSS